MYDPPLDPANDPAEPTKRHLRAILKCLFVGFVRSINGRTYFLEMTLTEPLETLVTTPIIDLRITGEHVAIPKWLCEPAPPALLALACLDFSSPPEVEKPPHAWR